MKNWRKDRSFIITFGFFVFLSIYALGNAFFQNYKLLNYDSNEDSSNLAAVDLEDIYLAENLDYLKDEVSLADEPKENQSLLNLSNDLPDDLISRAELVYVLADYFELSSDYQNCFSDVVGVDAWYEAAVCSAKELGFVNGYEDGTFHPEEPVTKAEALALVIRVFELDFSSDNFDSLDQEAKQEDNSFYLDVSEDDWFFNVAKISSQYGLIDQNEYFNFDYLMTRSDVAKVISNLVK